MIAFITSAQKIDSRYLYSAVSAERKIFILAQEWIKPGEYAIVSGTEREGAIDGTVKKASPEEYSKEISKIENFINKNCTLRKPKPFDAFLAKLSDIFDAAALMLARAAFVTRPIVLRFHSDTDGVCGGLALYYALCAKITRAVPQRVPVYTEKDCEDDARALSGNIEKLPPLLVCIDFGSSDSKAYKFVREKGWQILVIDHHPLSNGKANADLIVNPHFYGGDSDYTAGILAVEIAQRLSEKNLHHISQISTIGDRSKFAKDNKELKMASIALDYYVGLAHFPQKIEEFAKVIEDKELIQAANIQANEKLSAVVRRLLAKAKQSRLGKFKIVTICTDREFVDGEYPGRGEMTGAVCDTFPKNEPIIVIGWGKRAFNIRATPAAVEVGFDGNAIAQALKRAIGAPIEAGGGHKGAAGIRIKEGFANIVLDKLLKEIEKIK